MSMIWLMKENQKRRSIRKSTRNGHKIWPKKNKLNIMYVKYIFFVFIFYFVSLVFLENFCGKTQGECKKVRHVSPLWGHSEVSRRPSWIGLWRDRKLFSCLVYWSRNGRGNTIDSMYEFYIWISCFKKHNLMEHVSHQTMIMQFILELSKSLKIDPRQCVRPFFTR